MNKLLLSAVFGLLLLAQQAWGAIGCTLSNPAQDLKYLFPEMTSYKEDAREFGKIKEGEKHFKNLKVRLGSDLDPVYETYETPYTVYTVFKGETVIGIVHGVNVPGKGGVIQVFVSADPTTGEIKRAFFQRIESPAAKQLKSKEFLAQFNGVTLADLYKHDYYKVADPKSEKDKLGNLQPPANLDEKGKPDYEASLRGIRKNLILLDLFVFEQKAEPFYQRAQESIAKFNAEAKTGEAEAKTEPKSEAKSE
ncbi:MAG: hypothetical protein KIS92_24810 [Planctomycetota bacterium]|nr:hypothetical protein [Planctomycetota bacterium]